MLRNSGSFAVAVGVACRNALTASEAWSTGCINGEFNGLRHSPEAERPSGIEGVLLSAEGKEEEMPGQHRSKDTPGQDERLDDTELSDVPEDALVFEGTDVPVQYLLDYSDQWSNLYAFLRDFQQVSPEQALVGIREHVKAEIPAHSDRGRVSGIPVFKGSRVPIRRLFDQLADGVTVDEYLQGFPTAGREQVVRAIQLAGLLMESIAYENSL